MFIKSPYVETIRGFLLGGELVLAQFGQKSGQYWEKTGLDLGEKWGLFRASVMIILGTICIGKSGGGGQEWL